MTTRDGDGFFGATTNDPAIFPKGINLQNNPIVNFEGQTFDPVNFVPVWTNITVANNFICNYQKSGKRLTVNFYSNFTGSSTGIIFFNLPLGFTISAFQAGSDVFPWGDAKMYPGTGANVYPGDIIIDSVQTRVRFVPKTPYQLAANTWQIGQPVAQSGTVAIAGQFSYYVNE